MQTRTYYHNGNFISLFGIHNMQKKTLRAMVIKLERFSKAKCTPALLAEHKIMIQIISKNWLNNFCQNYCMCLIKPVL